MPLANYQPIRSILRQYDLKASLEDIWSYSQFISRRVAMPRYFEHQGPGVLEANVDRYVHDYRLRILVRELLLHATLRNNGLRRPAVWADLRDAINAIHKYAEDVELQDIKSDLSTVLHRIVNQQLPSFSRASSQTLGRYMALYDSPQFAPLFEARTGIPPRLYFLTAFACLALVLHRPVVDTDEGMSILGLDADVVRKFYARISAPLVEVRRKLIEDQSLGPDWEYTFNAVDFKPLIALDPRRPELVHCPLPNVLFRRLTEGLFFDVVNSDASFGNAFGAAFEALVGSVLQGANAVALTKPTPYRVGAELKAGVDWVVSDTSAQIFIECKTRRMSVAGKRATRKEDTLADVEWLAVAIAQNYKNIADIEAGLTDLPKNTAPMHSVIVTLETWTVATEYLLSELRERVLLKLRAACIDSGILGRCPYHVASLEELEWITGAMQLHGIEEVFGSKLRLGRADWHFKEHLQGRYPDADSTGGTNFSVRVEHMLRDAKIPLP